MINPLRRNRVYLRKKSDLLKDYVTGGLFLVTIGMFVVYQYRKINPPDPAEVQKQVSSETHPVVYLYEIFAKKYRINQVDQDDKKVDN